MFYRAQLLASKQQHPVAVTPGTPGTWSVKERVKDEVEKFLALRGSVNCEVDPQLWWREHSGEFVHLCKFYRAQCAFPATSTASERIFNLEGLVVTKYR